MSKSSLHAGLRSAAQRFTSARILPLQSGQCRACVISVCPIRFPCLVAYGVARQLPFKVQILIIDFLLDELPKPAPHLIRRNPPERIVSLRLCRFAAYLLPRPHLARTNTSRTFPFSRAGSFCLPCPWFYRQRSTRLSAWKLFLSHPQLKNSQPTGGSHGTRRIC